MQEKHLGKELCQSRPGGRGEKKLWGNPRKKKGLRRESNMPKKHRAKKILFSGPLTLEKREKAPGGMREKPNGGKLKKRVVTGWGETATLEKPENV